MLEQFQKRYQGRGNKAQTTQEYLNDAQFLFYQGGWTIAYVTPVKRPQPLWKRGLSPLLGFFPLTDFIVTYQRETNMYASYHHIPPLNR